MPLAGESDFPDVPAWPVVGIELRADGRIRVDDDMFVVPDGADMRQTAIAAVAATASLIGRPVRAEAREPDGTVWPLIVTPEGQAIAAGSGQRQPPTARRRGFRGGVLRRPSARSSTPAPPTSPPPAGLAQELPVPLPPPAPGTSAEQPPGPVPPGTQAPPGVVPRTTLAGASAPEADVTTRTALDRILAELRHGRPAAAHSQAQNLVDQLSEQRGRTDPGTDAAREVLAYTTFVVGDAAGAARIYADLAAPRVGSDLTDTHGERLADNAHFCWCRAGNSPEAQEAGARILALRTTGWGADSAPARAARRRLAAGGSGSS